MFQRPRLAREFCWSDYRGETGGQIRAEQGGHEDFHTLIPAGVFTHARSPLTRPLQRSSSPRRGAVFFSPPAAPKGCQTVHFGGFPLSVPPPHTPSRNTASLAAAHP
ncbi:hypothetical protein GN956_G4487 [Arapaima gigas]